MLGPLLPRSRRRPGCRGNAGRLRHPRFERLAAALAAAAAAPFTVISSGTWTIVMTVGGGLDRLDPRATRWPTSTPSAARCRRRASWAGASMRRSRGGRRRRPTPADLAAVIAAGCVAAADVRRGGRPVSGGGAAGSARRPGPVARRRGARLADLYLALVTRECLGLAGTGSAHRRRGTAGAERRLLRRAGGARRRAGASVAGRDRHRARRGAAARRAGRAVRCGAGRGRSAARGRRPRGLRAAMERAALGPNLARIVAPWVHPCAHGRGRAMPAAARKGSTSTVRPERIDSLPAIPVRIDQAPSISVEPRP